MEYNEDQYLLESIVMENGLDCYLLEQNDLTLTSHLPITKNDKSYIIMNKKGSIISKLDYYDYKIENFDWVLLANIQTNKKYRGQGLATRIINKACNDILKPNKGVYLFVRDTNDNAISLYKKLGFKLVKKYTLQDGEYLIMAKGNADKNQFNDMNFK